MDTLFCTQCGTKASSGCLFCSKCGTKLNSAEPPNTGGPDVVSLPEHVIAENRDGGVVVPASLSGLLFRAVPQLKWEGRDPKNTDLQLTKTWADIPPEDRCHWVGRARRGKRIYGIWPIRERCFTTHSSGRQWLFYFPYRPDRQCSTVESGKFFLGISIPLVVFAAIITLVMIVLGAVLQSVWVLMGLIVLGIASFILVHTFIIGMINCVHSEQDARRDAAEADRKQRLREMDVWSNLSEDLFPEGATIIDADEQCLIYRRIGESQEDLVIPYATITNICLRKDAQPLAVEQLLVEIDGGASVIIGGHGFTIRFSCRRWNAFKGVLLAEIRSLAVRASFRKDPDVMVAIS